MKCGRSKRTSRAAEATAAFILHLTSDGAGWQELRRMLLFLGIGRQCAGATTTSFAVTAARVDVAPPSRLVLRCRRPRDVPLMDVFEFPGDQHGSRPGDPGHLADDLVDEVPQLVVVAQTDLDAEVAIAD